MCIYMIYSYSNQTLITWTLPTLIFPTLDFSHPGHFPTKYYPLIFFNKKRSTERGKYFIFRWEEFPTAIFPRRRSIVNIAHIYFFS